MARQRQYDTRPFDAARASADIEADGLARLHGLDPDRVRRVLQDTARDFYGNPLPVPAAGIDTLEHGLRFEPSLDEAIRFLGPSEALALFESEDMRRLADHHAAFDYLTEESTPLYTISELAELLDSFLSHLERNREHLLRTGHPRRSFARSRWLDWHLTKLYYVKLPLTMHASRDDLGDYEYRYEWPDKPAENLRFPTLPGIRFIGGGHGYLRGPNGTAYTDDGSAVASCSYDEAALIVDLDPVDAAHLVAGRQQVFNLKVSVLDRLIVALRRGDPSRLWTDCLGVLTDSLLADEAGFYLRMDRSYTGFDILTGQTVDAGADLIAGGLTSLLEVIGHCEKELAVGTMDRTKRRLLAIPEALALMSYYQAAGRPWRPDLDAALDSFANLDARERAFWGDFRRRVNDALENEFYEEVVIRTKVRRKLVAKFKPQVRTFAEWQKAHLEATGVLPALSLHSPELPTIDDEYVFRRDGEYWTLQYDGRQVRMKHAKGLADLAILLSRRDQPIPAVELETLSSGRPPARPVQGITNASRDQLSEQGLHVVGMVDGGAVPDRQALDEYRRQYRDLQAELRDAEDSNDVERASRLREQLEWLKDEVARATGLGGRRRNVDADAERARKRVSARIEETIRKIERQHPSLGRHLRNSVETGTTCSYSPEADTAWTL